jgi:hypothetical protein
MTTPINLGSTPGPWRVVDNTDLNDALWIEVDHPEVGNVSLAQVINGCDEADELGSMEANAQLISAAPDMLAALHTILNHHAGSLNTPAYEAAMSAIAKAEGPALQSTGGEKPDGR